MPVYSITSEKKLAKDIKKKIVDLFTDAHCSIMIAPEQFVHVFFSDGMPLTGKRSLYIHANVRKGREQHKIDTLKTTLITECARILNVNEDKVHVNLLEINAKWVMEGGHIMPDPGEEDEWMEKVTSALEKRELAT